MSLNRREIIQLASAIEERRDARRRGRSGRRSAHLAEGTYGLCLDCGADIPVERLRAAGTQSGAGGPRTP